MINFNMHHYISASYISINKFKMIEGQCDDIADKEIPQESSKPKLLGFPIVQKQQKFQPTPVGIIYEEISLLDSFNDARYTILIHNNL